MFELMKLPYELNALEPHMSAETLEYHYGKHHKTYVDKLNWLIVWTEFEGKTLEEIIVGSKTGPIFNNAAQIWNHNLFWNILKKNNGQGPSGKLFEALEKDFWSFENFKESFKNTALWLFGSGWVWLSQNTAWNLVITSTPNAANPLVTWENTLLWIDVWEHAYYIDYRNNRGGFIDNFWNIVDWEAVEKKMK
jgi:superoxide dismutase, Fe-Mn family